MSVYPFKLINQHEMETLLTQAQTIRKIINKYCDCREITLSHCLTAPTLSGSCALFSQQQPLLVLTEKTLATLQHHLLGTDETHPVYRRTCEKILLEAFGHFFKTDPLVFGASCPPPDWFYRGSPCLKININLGEHALEAYINPHWVQQQGAPLKKFPRALSDTLDGLRTKTVPLEVRCKTFPLNLQDLSQLEAGDVIQLDHPADQPLQLCYQSTPLAGVTIGRVKEQLAIKIGEPL